MNWIEFTCGECGNKYTEQTGDTDERVCDECLNHEDINIIKKEETMPDDIILDLARTVEILADSHNCNDGSLKLRGLDWAYLHKLNRRSKYWLNKVYNLNESEVGLEKELDPGYDVDVDENGPFISKTVDYGPPYSMANPTGEPVKRRIEVEITYEGEEE